MNGYQYGYRNGRYRGAARADSVGLFGWALSMIFGAGLSVGLLIFLSTWSFRWVMAGLTVALVVGGVLCLVGRRYAWPVVIFFDVFAITTLLIWLYLMQFRVTDMVVFWNEGHLKVAGAVIGGLAAVAVFLWEKKRLDEPPVLVALFLAAAVGFLCFGLCYEALVGVNILADERESRQTTAQVLRVEDKYHTYYQGRATHYYLVYFVVVGENDLTSGGKYPVDKAAYDSLEPGDEVRLTLHLGALGAPWMECEPAEN